MRIPIIKIGNSKGLRLSKQLLDHYQINDEVDLILDEGQIVLKPISSPRKGWDAAFQQMAQSKDDTPLLPDVFEDEDFEEWN